LGVTNSSTITVAPMSSWLNLGDRIMIAHFESSTDDLEKVKTLWNARTQLSLITNPDTQRAFASPANNGRHIKTWIDANNDNAVNAGEIVDFANTAITASNYGFFNVSSVTDAQNLVDYVRGKEISGYRSRTIDYDGNGSTEVIRLADVVNSTPTIVGPTQEGFDLLYKDTSYAVFRKQYAQRRQVLYVGSNGGMLHAINGGFYSSTSNAFRVSGKKYDGVTDAVQHPLGSEIWAYTPMNLLPHLKWLKSNNYSHVYYMDGKPKVFDAKIFAKDADHPGLTTDSKGWGTIMVVGMRLGGGPITVDTAADGLTGDTTPGDNRVFQSAYVILDITNPEEGPRVLAEIQVPDSSFSTSYPAVMTVKDKTASFDDNKWFLTFGSGPNNLNTAASSTNAKLYLFDLDELMVPGSSANSTFPSGCSRQPIGTNGNMRILSCDTGFANSFVGDPMTVDWDLDYKADSVYFGLVGDSTATSGRLMRLDVNEKSDPGYWTAPATVINTSQPVLAAATPALDDANQKWIFFGTGRFFVKDDQTSKAAQSIYGLKEKGTEVTKTNLLNVSNAQVATDGTLTGISGTSGALTTFNALKSEINNYEGWYLDLPPIQGTAGSAPATRVINSSALTGGILFTSAYQPGLDLCSGEGTSRLYGLYYTTGTASPSPATFSTVIINGKDMAPSFIELGHGFATTPSLHSGAGTGDTAVNVFTQLSTGTIVRTEASTVFGVRSKMTSWKEN
jgi:type IV pilus assembly protein PilY1